MGGGKIIQKYWLKIYLLDLTNNTGYVINPYYVTTLNVEDIDRPFHYKHLIVLGFTLTAYLFK